MDATASYSASGITEEGAALIAAAQAGNAEAVRGWMSRGGDVNAVFQHVRGMMGATTLPLVLE